jgi:hypothetical protein
VNANVASPVGPQSSLHPMRRGRAVIALFSALVAFLAPASTFANAGTAPAPQENAISPYHSIAVGQPASNATIFDNAGNVEVAIVISPSLRASDRIALNVDGRPMPPRSRNRFELSGLDRGEHTLKARVIDADGDTLISSALVTFYVWRGSVLFPTRRKG